MALGGSAVHRKWIADGGAAPDMGARRFHRGPIESRGCWRMDTQEPKHFDTGLSEVIVESEISGEFGSISEDETERVRGWVV